MAMFGNPKTHLHRTNPWYEYYADYSEPFVEDVLTHFEVSETAVVLDPWNGSGTTTQVAEDRGLLAFGYDINPVMVMVARARRLDPDCSVNLAGLCNDIVKKAMSYKHRFYLERDPLHIWLSEQSAGMIRNLEGAVQVLLLDQDYEPLCKSESYDKVNSLVSVFYAALFQTVRGLLESFRSSNPTWIKEPKEAGEIIDVDAGEIVATFKKRVSSAIAMLESRKPKRISVTRDAVVDVASSTAIPLKNAKANVVISSPPYCTRIDYAVATRPELAVLGYSQAEIDSLRDKIIGTTTIFNKDIGSIPDWGKTCNSFLTSVYHHGSKASKTYYYSNFLQYFDSVYRSFNEIDRVLSGDGLCVLVVQDSYYKDLHNDLPQMFIEFGMSLRWKLHTREDHRVDRTMAGINRQSKRYRSSSSAVESVLVFER